jgi:hypothetical protein
VRRGQGAVADLKRRPDRHIVGGEVVQPAALVAQGRGQPGQAPPGAGGQVRAGDADRQRQVPTQPHDLRGGRVGGAPPGDPAQQRDRVAGREQAQVEQVRAGQPDQRGPAGHQHRTAGRAGDQRPDLPLVDGVVDHHEHPPARGAAAVQGDPLRDRRRDRRPVDAERAEEPAHHVGRIHRPVAAAAQVHVQLAAGEGRRQPVRGVHGQHALADTTHPGDRHDRHRAAGRDRAAGRGAAGPGAAGRDRAAGRGAAGPGAAGRDRGEDRRHLPPPAGEVRYVRWKLRGRRHRVVGGAQARGVRVVHLGRRADPEVVGQPPAHPGDLAHGLGVPADRVQQPYQAGLHRFVVRRRSGEIGQPGYGVGGAAESQRQVGQAAAAVDPGLLDGAHQRIGAEPFGPAAQHRPAPLVERGRQPVELGGRVLARAGRSGVRAEPGEVDRVRRHVQPVAGRGALQPRRVGQPDPQPRHRALQCAATALVGTPGQVEQAVVGDRLAGGEQQHAENGLPGAARQRQIGSADPGRQVAEHAEADQVRPRFLLHRTFTVLRRTRKGIG